MGPTPLLKMVFSYGLRPRLWLLPKVEISRHDVFLLLFFVQLDCHLAVAKSVNRLLQCQFSRAGFQSILLLQLITVPDNFLDWEEVGFLLRFYRPSAGLLGAVFVLLPGSWRTICLLLITEGQHNYKLKASKGKGFSSVSLTPKRKYHMWKRQREVNNSSDYLILLQKIRLQYWSRVADWIWRFHVRWDIGYI